MFYCNDCADKKGWPKLAVRSYGPCDECRKMNLCNDSPVKDIPVSDGTIPIANRIAKQMLERERAKKAMAMSEDQIKQQMGDKYHICDKCSTSASIEQRNACRRSQPVTIGDFENVVEALVKLIDRKALFGV